MSVVGCQNTFNVNEIMSVTPGNMFSSLKLFSWAGLVLLRYSVFPLAFMVMEGWGRLVPISLLWAHLNLLREDLDVLMVLTSLSLYVHIKYDTKLLWHCIQKPVAWLYFASGRVVEMGSLQWRGRDPEEQQPQGFSTSLLLLLSPCGDLAAGGSWSLALKWFAWAASSFQDFFQALLQTLIGLINSAYVCVMSYKLFFTTLRAR